MKTVNIIGYIDQEPSFETLPSENVRATFQVSVPVSIGSEHCDEYDCVVFGRVASMLRNYFQEGMGVAITGELGKRDGQTVIKVGTIQHLVSRSGTIPIKAYTLTEDGKLIPGDHP